MRVSSFFFLHLYCHRRPACTAGRPPFRRCQLRILNRGRKRAPTWAPQSVSSSKGCREKGRTETGEVDLANRFVHSEVPRAASRPKVWLSRECHGNRGKPKQTANKNS